MTICPIECVRSACPDPDFLEKHETFVLTVLSLLSGVAGACLSFFLKSRCTKLTLCCLSCDRIPVPLEPSQVEIRTVSDQEPASQSPQ